MFRRVHERPRPMPKAGVPSRSAADHRHLERASPKDGGRALDADTRGYMESRFGHDFSTVRVHADTGATASARELGAAAYTVGQHIVFGPGRYQPETPSGGRLL